MTTEVIIADQAQHVSQIRELFWEYLQWANSRVNEEFKVSFSDIKSFDWTALDL